MDARVCKQARSKSKEYSVSKESNKFTNQFDFTPKEIDIKDEAKEIV